MANTAISALPTATAVASGDVVPVVQGGTTKKVDVSLLGGSGSGESWIGYAATSLAPAQVGGVVTAGTLYLARVTRGAGAAATKVGLQVGVASGNIMVGVYRNTGSGVNAGPAALVASSAVTPCPAAGYAEVALTATVAVAPGDWLAIWCDNTTATFGYTGNSTALGTSTAPTNKSISAYTALATNITALPNPISTTIAGFARHFYLLAY